MINLPLHVTSSSLWVQTLASRMDDTHHLERERLRSTFVSFRERSAALAGQISKDLPDLTVHDITHIDALWELSSIVAGTNYSLTPTEGFVLGGAILLHDLAMSVSAIDGGYSALRADYRWSDLVTFEYQTKYHRMPTPSEILEPESEILGKSTFNILRQIHAERAEQLAFISFKATGEVPVYLIDDIEIRQTFGRIIGQIAHSHWWSVHEVEAKFQHIIGAPHWCPPEWTIDPLKIGFLLRSSDVIHLDGRRAPIFIKAFNHIPAASLKHWVFQEKLNKPYLNDDALAFTSGSAFKLNDAASWWLCLDTLRLADKELRSIDAVLAEKGYKRFAAKRVAGVDNPERLASYVQTDGWFPINAIVHVSDLASIIQSLGGKELYGDYPQVALRELIQNSCDAIRARNVYETREPSLGKISVTLCEEKDGNFWLEVMDNGIGMSRRVLTEVLLDFGNSFWGSPMMQEELPGLLSSGLKTTGKYGIGFFTVFMISERVQISTRRSDHAARETLVLEFRSGLEGRPILRPATRLEQLKDGGSRIKVLLKTNPYHQDGLLYSKSDQKKVTLEEALKSLCPAIDTNLHLQSEATEIPIIKRNDWMSMDALAFLDRLPVHGFHEERSKINIDDYKLKIARNLRPIIEENGQIVGRALITPGHIHDPSGRFLGGVVAIGGLEACTLAGICGILLGQPMRASRDEALPIVSPKALKTWAEEQGRLVPDVWSKKLEQSACAQFIWMCGGDTKHLPICIHKGKWLSADKILRMKDLPDKIIIIDHFLIDYHLKHIKDYQLEHNIFISRSSMVPSIIGSRSHQDRWPSKTDQQLGGEYSLLRSTLAGSIVSALATAWGTTVSHILEKSGKREKEVKVAMKGSEPILESALVVMRPD